MNGLVTTMGNEPVVSHSTRTGTRVCIPGGDENFNRKESEIVPEDGSGLSHDQTTWQRRRHFASGASHSSLRNSSTGNILKLPGR